VKRLDEPCGIHMPNGKAILAKYLIKSPYLRSCDEADAGYIVLRGRIYRGRGCGRIDRVVQSALRTVCIQSGTALAFFISHHEWDSQDQTERSIDSAGPDRANFSKRPEAGTQIL
jgi:hypothetical protein